MCAGCSFPKSVRSCCPSAWDKSSPLHKIPRTTSQLLVFIFIEATRDFGQQRLQLKINRGVAIPRGGMRPEKPVQVWWRTYLRVRKNIQL